MTNPTQALVERLFGNTIGALELMSVYLGLELGLYRALAEASCTPEELAERAGIAPRYAREWLEQQAVAGLVEAGSGSGGLFALPEAHAEVLLDAESLDHVAPFALMCVGIAKALPAVLEAYRSGGGVPFGDYGADMRRGQAAINRPAFMALLPGEWLDGVPQIRARLEADPPARVADIGCGEGWAAIGLARAFPKIRVDGFDLDAPSIAAARRNARAHGVDDRVQFAERDAGDPSDAGSYQLVCMLEALHDMAHPVEALSAARVMLAGGGSLLIADERVAEEFHPPGDDIERMMYGWSVLHCLPAGLADADSAATGTVMRPDTVRAYARSAGWEQLAIAPIENELFRFYRLDK